MAITVNLMYMDKDGSARKFAEEMLASGTVAAIRVDAGIYTLAGAHFGGRLPF